MRKILMAAAVFAATLVPGGVADAAVTAVTAPTIVTYGVYPWARSQAVESTITVDTASTVAMVRTAYRQPTKTVTFQVEPGTTTLSVPCSSYRLSHRWTVEVDGRAVTAASLNCR